MFILLRRRTWCNKLSSAFLTLKIKMWSSWPWDWSLQGKILPRCLSRLKRATELLLHNMWTKLILLVWCDSTLIKFRTISNTISAQNHYHTAKAYRSVVLNGTMQLDIIREIEIIGIQNYWDFGLSSSSGILKSRHIILVTGSVLVCEVSSLKGTHEIRRLLPHLKTETDLISEMLHSIRYSFRIADH